MLNGMITNKYGSKCRCQNNQLHRTNGPAVEFIDGTKAWYQNDLLHRTDGPAVEFIDGDKYWYINGVQYNFNEWLEQVNYTEPQKTLMRLRYA
jgi:hypothetical protein